MHVCAYMAPATSLRIADTPMSFASPTPPAWALGGCDEASTISKDSRMAGERPGSDARDLELRGLRPRVHAGLFAGVGLSGLNFTAPVHAGAAVRCLMIRCFDLVCVRAHAAAACFEEQIDYYGNDLTQVAASFASECQRRCQAAEKCQYFTIHSATCYLKTSAAGKKQHSVGVSGPKRCGTCLASWAGILARVLMEQPPPPPPPQPHLGRQTQAHTVMLFVMGEGDGGGWYSRAADFLKVFG